MKGLAINIGSSMTTVGANRLGDCIQSSTIEKYVCLRATAVQRGVVQALFEKYALSMSSVCLSCVPFLTLIRDDKGLAIQQNKSSLPAN